MPDGPLHHAVVAAFDARFGGPPPAVVRAPGRVNLIGEHTDYNDGFVMPIALGQAVWIALRARADDRVRLHSADVEAEADVCLSDEACAAGWGAHVYGVGRALVADGHVPVGFEGVLASDVPVGAGLSSSAALELAVARAFSVVSGILWDARRMALVAQHAENEWVGVACGVMDPMASALGQAGHALLIDCRTLGVTAVALPPGAAVVVLDTGTRRTLSGSAYNTRRMECEAAARALGVPALRDADADAVAGLAGRVPDVVFRRARHVVTENARVLDAAAAMEAGDAGRFGARMNESHASLRDDYDVTGPALDAIVEAAARHPSCYGARMTGAGFGGCAVALVEAACADAFAAEVCDTYAARTGHEPRACVAIPSAGASVVASRVLD